MRIGEGITLNRQIWLVLRGDREENKRVEIRPFSIRFKIVLWAGSFAPVYPSMVHSQCAQFSGRKNNDATENYYKRPQRAIRANSAIRTSQLGLVFYIYIYSRWFFFLHFYLRVVVGLRSA